MSKLIRRLAQRFTRDETGATMVEYALMVALVAAVCVVAVTAVGNAVKTQLTSIASSI